MTSVGRAERQVGKDDVDDDGKEWTPLWSEE